MESLTGAMGHLSQRLDSIFSLILLFAAFLFFAGEFLWRFRGWNIKSTSSIPDDNRLKLMWSLVPAVVLLMLAFVQSGSALHRRAQKVANSQTTPIRAAK